MILGIHRGISARNSQIVGSNIIFQCSSLGYFEQGYSALLNGLWLSLGFNIVDGENTTEWAK